jgi:hypothetical protein
VGEVEAATTALWQRHRLGMLARQRRLIRSKGAAEDVVALDEGHSKAPLVVQAALAAVVAVR